MKKTKKHTWKFASRFSRKAFGWRSTLPIKRVNEAVKEIKACARKEPLLAAMGKKDEALRYAEDSRDNSSSPVAISQSCEEILPPCPVIGEKSSNASFEEKCL